MKKASYKELSTEDLQAKLAQEKDALTRMKLNHSISPLDNPSQLKAMRKNIARMNTELSLRGNK